MAQIVLTVTHDPNALRDYTIDWDRSFSNAPAGTGFLPSGVTIATSAWVITPTTVPPMTVDTDSNDTTTSTVRLTGGLNGTNYYATCHVVASNGEEEDAIIEVLCRNVVRL